ncbi:hypothetical protein FB451DRAFT_299859 [Mycena latifolia]|nr:hypothetical protein FB451DRAFT_299859 [Mycena latifolia]
MLDPQEILKRIPACLNCMLRKLRCDGGKPICGPCIAYPLESGDSCRYPDGTGPSRKLWDDSRSHPEPLAVDAPYTDYDEGRNQRSSSPINEPGSRVSSPSSRVSSPISGFSDSGAESDESSFSSTTESFQWTVPSYDIPSHQLLLNDLDLTGKVNKLDKYPFESGGAADIYRGTLNSANSSVAFLACD